MKLLDKLIQRWRINKIRPFLKPGDRVLDIGCSDGILFRLIRGIHGVGLDLICHNVDRIEGVELIDGSYPEAISANEIFDKVCMLAVLEHIPADRQPLVAESCFKHLKPNGYLMITVPSSSVDRILDILTFMRLVEGIEVHQHYGFKPSMVPSLFGNVGFELVEASKFQFGLNNLFVFKRPAKT